MKAIVHDLSITCVYVCLFLCGVCGSMRVCMSVRVLCRNGITANAIAHYRFVDCELMRKLLLGEKEKWSVIGQSFGGFCVV